MRKRSAEKKSAPVDDQPATVKTAALALQAAVADALTPEARKIIAEKIVESGKTGNQRGIGQLLRCLNIRDNEAGQRRGGRRDYDDDSETETISDEELNRMLAQVR